jgi:hypothetical protein
VFILKGVKVICFVTLLQVLIIRELLGHRKACCRSRNLALKEKAGVGSRSEGVVSYKVTIIEKTTFVKQSFIGRALLEEGGQVPVFGVRRQAPVRQRGSVSP